MLVKKYKVRVVSVTNLLNDIYTLEFESLNGIFRYAPGQFLHLALDRDYDGSGQWPESRCFSMQTNADNTTIKITYAVKGVFTKLMADSIVQGTELWLKLPFGELFTQDHNRENTVFIAGGTGVTPYLSLFTHSSFSEYTNPKIFLGFRTQSHNIYLEEIDFIKKLHPAITDNINLIYQDIDGVLDIRKILAGNDISATYFISGPPTMISSFKNILLNQGVQNIMTDDWE